MRKRILGVILMLSLLLPYCCTQVSAASIGINDFAQKRLLLESLGVMVKEDNSSQLTTKEFAEYMIAMFGISYESDEEFLAVAKALNILDEQDLSILDMPLEFDEACKMSVSALGYDIIAEEKGGYPYGYRFVAADKKVMRNLSYTTNFLVTDAIQMLYNMTDIPLCRIQTNSYVSAEGTILSLYRNVYTAEGKVTAVKGQTMSGAEVNSESLIAIDSVVYTLNIPNASDFFAKEVIYYYRDYKDLEQPQVLYMYANPSDTHTINARDITRVLYSKGNYTIYFNDLKEKEYRQRAFPKYINLNGETVDAATVDMQNLLDFSDGSIDLIDYDGDEIADVMLIEKYENYFVTFVGTETIYDKYGKPELNFDFEDSDYTYSFYKDGKIAKFSDINENNVLSVYKSLNGKNIKIVISEKSTYGKIMEIEELSGRSGHKLVIDMFPIYTTMDASALKVGDETNFYFDINGLVAGYSESDMKSSLDYGYLAAMSADSFGGGMEFRIFTKNDGMQLYKSTSSVNVTFAGVTKKYSFEQIKSILFENGKFKPQLVQYTASGENILRIAVAANYAENKEYFQLVKEGEAKYANNKLGNFALDFGSGRTWVVSIPPDSEMDDERKYTSNYPLVNGNTYNYTVYDIDSFIMAKAVVIKQKASERVTNKSSLDRGTPLSVIESIKKISAWNEAEETEESYWEVTVGLGGTKRKLKVMDAEFGLFVGEQWLNSGSVMVDSYNGTRICVDTRDGKFLSPGDVGQCVVDNDYLVAFRRWYRAAENLMPFNRNYFVPGYSFGVHGGEFVEATFCYGQVKNISSKYLVVDVSNEFLDSGYSLYEYLGTSVYPIIYDRTVGYIFHKASGKVEVADKKDIKKGDDIIFSYTYFNFNSFVIMRND